MATLFQRQRKNGDKKWFIKYKNEAGEWRMKSCRTTKKTVANLILQKYSAEEFNRIHKAPIVIPEYSALEAFENFLTKELPKSRTKKMKQQSSIRREKRAFENFADFIKDSHVKKLVDISKVIIEQYFRQRRIDDNVSTRTRREERRVIRQFFNWAQRNFLVPDNPTDDIEILEDKEPSPPYFFSEEKLIIIFDNSKQPYTNIFKFLYLTGLRIGELSNLEWSDYNRIDKELKIRVVEAKRRKDNNGIKIEGNKTKHEETIPLNNDAVDILNRIQENSSDKYIFTNGHGTKLDNDNIYRNLKRTLSNCGLENGSPHTFRHTFASHLVQKGISLFVIKDLLRHKSIKETEIYSHLSKKVVMEAVSNLSIDNLKCALNTTPKNSLENTE